MPEINPTQGLLQFCSARRTATGSAATSLQRERRDDYWYTLISGIFSVSSSEQRVGSSLVCATMCRATTQILFSVLSKTLTHFCVAQARTLLR
ncbi:hypothetical protein MRB53_002813 [Persea americana]|uniref:Uncharacterized protein n=1 Tax=Persea americana TaxID=3435 RepID=A0ACC2MWH5_PERAE|nr:hypothetical protein MRB53_002813 [Persea americana]